MTLVQRFRVALGVLALALMGAGPGRAQGVLDRQKVLDARIATLNAEAAKLAGEQRTLLGRLRQLQVARETRLLEIERTDAALARVGPEVVAAGARVTASEAALRRVTPEIRERLRRTYKLMPLGYDRVLLSLEQARSFDRAARVVSVVARRDRVRLEQFRQLKEARRAEADRLQRERATLQTLRLRLQQEEAALAATSATQAALLKQIRDQREVNAQLVDELGVARDRLDRSVSALGPSTGYAGRPAGGAGATTPRTGGLGAVRGLLEWPVAGRLQSRFGREVSERFQTAIIRNGIEIGAALGAAVRASHDGRVAYADAFTGFGRVVIVDHGGKAYTLYGHLATIDVVKDERIARGRTVGTVGTAPTGTTSLYFEVRVDGRPVDPLQWLKAKSVGPKP